MRNLIKLIPYFMIGSCSVAIATEHQNLSTALETVAEYQRESKFAHADNVLKELLNQNPQNQKVCLYHGLNLRYQGQYKEAEEELSRAVQLEPDTYYGQQAAFLLAKVQYLGEKPENALATIAKLKREHPDSGWVPQAWVLEDEIKGLSTTESSEKLTKQNAGEKVYKSILASKSVVGTTITISKMLLLAQEYDGLPIGLAAKEAAGNLLTTTDRTFEAIEVFKNILLDVQSSGPNSRIAQTATQRLAALHHRLKLREDALLLYQKSTELADKRSITEHAYLHSAAIAFELVQKDSMAGIAIHPNRWNEVEALINFVQQDDPTTSTRIIADLMALELSMWSRSADKALALGLGFLDSYSTMTTTHKKEIATAYVALSRLYKDAGMYKNSMFFAQKALTMYPEEKEIWPNTDLLQRAYYDLIESAYLYGDISQGNILLTEFADRFPSSDYIRAIKNNLGANFYNSIQEGQQ